MPMLKTERLHLRTLELGDLDSVMAFWGNNEVMQYCGGSKEDRPLEGRAIENYRRSQELRGYSALAVVLRNSNTVIGACGFNYTDQDDTI